MKNKNLSLEELEKAIKGYFRENPKVIDIFPKHFTGENEDVTRYSYWKIGNLVTGDGGKEMFDKEFKKIFGKLK